MKINKMQRNTRFKVKKEVPETSTSHSRGHEEHDLAYYIHDRVELMHQVFSVIKYKDIKAMAPACIRNISIDDLEELCTEELLGISSKRLCAILDGAEPPSDTESSSQSAGEPLETISLDSISSDEEILSQEEKSKKKKHKHHHRDSKSKTKHTKSKNNGDDAPADTTDMSKASRAGLTVLELLELQARARAIRAQLQQEQTKPAESVAAEFTHSPSEDDEVEIKEEPAEVVEISSDEEKPKVEELRKKIPLLKSPEPSAKTVTKRVNDLVITVPQQKRQKIKLNRTKSVPKDTIVTKSAEKKQNIEDNTDKVKGTQSSKDKTKKDKPKESSKSKEVNKKEKTKKIKKKRLSNAQSDNDEITLQLSDTEKMDLLEDLDRKNYDNVSSDTCSDSDSDAEVSKKVTSKQSDKENTVKEKTISRADRVSRDSTTSKIITREDRMSQDNKKSKDNDKIEGPKQDLNVETEKVGNSADIQNTEVEFVKIKDTGSVETENPETIKGIIDSQPSIESTSVCVTTSQTDNKIVEENKSETDNNNDAEASQSDDLRKNVEETDKTDKNDVTIEESTAKKDPVKETEAMDEPKPVTDKKISDGELTDRESSEVEAFDIKPEVVCISDEEEAATAKKKKKKKDKKNKKDKKSKKKDFRESADQNFHDITKQVISITHSVINQFETASAQGKITVKYNDSQTEPVETIQAAIKDNKPLKAVEIDVTTPGKSQDSIVDPNQGTNANESNSEIEGNNEIVEISDEVYELSGDSSNEDESETRNVLSKEPTASEIEALSAKIDEIERVEVITDDEIKVYESKHSENEEEVSLSWKDRYLDSKKVKRVLNTSNILNALRKKNRQLKKRLEESKIELQETAEEVQEDLATPTVPEGSIEQYNTLEGSTKFVDPVKEPPINDNLKKDAKQLLKMYKKLLKYNDMSRKKEKDPNKKKKKKKKSKKEAEDKGADKISE